MTLLDRPIFETGYSYYVQYNGPAATFGRQYACACETCTAAAICLLVDFLLTLAYNSDQ